MIGKRLHLADDVISRVSQCYLFSQLIFLLSYPERRIKDFSLILAFALTTRAWNLVTGLMAELEGATTWIQNPSSSISSSGLPDFSSAGDILRRLLFPGLIKV